MPDDTPPASWRKGCIAIVCGGRDYSDKERLRGVLDSLGPGLIIHGAYGGADTLAQRYGDFFKVHCASVRALWEHYGRRGGPIRNSAMLLLRPDLVVAFPGGSGTADMASKAERKGIPVMRIDW